MGILANRSYIDKLNCARIYCCIAYEDAYILNEIAEEVFECYEKDAFISFRNDIKIGDRGTGSELTGMESEAQILLAIISNNFLKQGQDDGSMEEFRYAVENNIPILPIAIEPELEEPFNNKCGKLELIFKYGDSYREVLKENLQRLLIGIEIKKQIREHFFGNIFLSYRRLDLKHAKEAMKIVHEFDNCEDVGIWYDGALVPGEDYEEQIFAHLSKCDCVLMMVTDRLLESGNFIMNEFPRVKESGMKILPYVVDNVDINELSKCYKGLFDEYPSGIRSKDELREVLSSIYPEHKSVWNAEHTFYMGMAYLYGVDFENNVYKAIKYFKISADAGNIQALAELVKIYEHCIEIKPNLEHAIQYQKKYIKRLREMEKSHLVTNVVLIDEMFKLGRMYEKNSKYEEAKSVYNEIFSCYDFQLRPGQEKEYYLSLARVYEHMGLLEKTNDNYDEAVHKLLLAEKCVDNAERVAIDQSQRDFVEFEYSRIAESMAMTILDLGSRDDLKKADLYIQIALKPYEKACYNTDFDNKKRRVLSRLYYIEGLIEKEFFNQMCKDKSIDKKELLEQLNWISDILKNALEFCPETDFNESIRNISAYHSLILILEELKNIYYNMFSICPSPKYLDRYNSYLKKIMHILMNVNQDQDVKNALINKINECILIGEFFAKNSIKEIAKYFYQCALEGMRKVGLSEDGEEIKTVIKNIMQLSS